MKTKTKKYEYRCIRFNQGDHEFVCFTAPASELWRFLSINQKIEDKDEGYQRALSVARVRSIAKYVVGKNPVPLSILVSLEPDNYKLSADILQITTHQNAGWVIDGQHRLAGCHESATNIVLPVVAFLQLDIKEQIHQFVTINKEARGVPTSLYYDLLKHLPAKSAGDIAKERAADIAHQLKKNEESPFFNRIVTVTAPKRGEISLNIFVKKVGPLIQDNKGLLAAYSATEQEKIFANYYNALANVFPKQFNEANSIFFQTLGFGSLIRVLPAFFSLTIKNTNGFTVADATGTFNSIKHFDFEGWKKMGTGNAAEIAAADDLRSELEGSASSDALGSKINL